LIGSEKNKTKEREQFDHLHQCLVQAAQRQSEHDYPQMSIQNGITDGTKMCGSERVGNCFILLCVLNTAASHGPEINQTRIEKQKHFLEKYYFLPQIIIWI
jgi:hypothetical protein